MKTGVKVSDAMTKKPLLVKADKNIVECAKKMREHDTGSLIVKDNKEFLGFVTETDFVELLTKDFDLKNTKIKDIMTPKNEVISVEPEIDLYDALIIMQDEEFKRLPVMKEGKLVGILTVKDILKIQPQLFDLLVEKFDLKDESEKIFFSDGKEGVCDICSVKGNIFNVRGKHLCRACRDTL